MDGHSRRVSSKRPGFPLHPAQRTLNVKDAPVASGAASCDVLLEGHPANRASAVVEGHAKYVMESGQSAHIIRFSLSKLVGTTVDEDHHWQASLRACIVRPPNVCLKTIFTAISGRRIVANLHTCGAPHISSDSTIWISTLKILGRFEPLCIGKRYSKKLLHSNSSRTCWQQPAVNLSGARPCHWPLSGSTQHAKVEMQGQ
mmetsp:Transcript_32823/g.59939  ORF Transcript_32823/g.59939 Transcript_32823/m.59939 type:complete len:201 (-) Transcript_32823:88-690(-)